MCLSLMTVRIESRIFASLRYLLYHVYFHAKPTQASALQANTSYSFGNCLPQAGQDMLDEFRSRTEVSRFLCPIKTSCAMPFGISELEPVKTQSCPVRSGSRRLDTRLGQWSGLSQ